MNCDVCNEAFEGEPGTLSPQTFRSLLALGWGIHPHSVDVMTRDGSTRAAAVEALRERYARSETPWALCAACEREAAVLVLTNDEVWLGSHHVSVSKTATDVGMGFETLRAPVALSRDVWTRYVEWQDEDSGRQVVQEQDARLWDVMFTGGATLQLRLGDLTSPRGHRYSVMCVPRDGESEEAVSVALRMRIGEWRDHAWIFIEEAGA